MELQGVAGLPVFRAKESYQAFLESLRLISLEQGSRIHAFCLTSSRVLILASFKRAEEAGELIQGVNRRFLPVLRQMQGEATGGTVWEPRFKSTEIQPGRRSLLAMIYVDRFALREQITSSIASYPWSSYQHHAGEARYSWLSQLPGYWQMGNTPFDRQLAYRKFADQGLPPDEIKSLSSCLQKGWLWGDDDFCEQIQPLANRPVRPRKRGRPLKGAQNE